METLFDYQAFEMQNHGGVSRSAVGFYKHLPSDIRATIGVWESNNVYLKEFCIPTMESQYYDFFWGKKFKGKRKLFSTYFRLKNGFNYWNARNQNYCIKLLKKNKFDLFHPTFFNDYFLDYLGKTPFVLTVHDMIPELYPDQFGHDDFQILKKKKLVPLAQRIIVASQNTGDDLVHFLKVPYDKISVVHRGIEPDRWNGYDLTYTKENMKPYILYVGGRSKYKNFVHLILSSVPLLKDNKDLKIICTGTPFDKEELQLFANYGCLDRIECVFVKTDFEMAKLYHNAIAFVFPSQYEGFGIPILECYQANGLLVLNHASCFPEVAGDAALYFTQNGEKSDLTEVLEHAINMSSSEREYYLNKQRQRIYNFAWDKVANDMATAYRLVC